jgi:cathepsin X
MCRVHASLTLPAPGFLLFRGSPVAATINAEPIVNYKGGVFADESFPQDTNHIVSIVGWETNPDTGLSWIIRNSWGEYWGEMGFMRLVAGKNLLGIEEAVAWATPGTISLCRRVSRLDLNVR